MAIVASLPLSRSIASSLQTCLDLGLGRITHALIVELGLQQLRFLGNMLIFMYGRCGALPDAFSAFYSVPSPNVFSWNIMMRACVSSFHFLEALHLFQRMQFSRVDPDRVSFLTCVSACAELRDVQEGRTIEVQISDSGMKDDLVIGTALMNMYCKCSSLQDAFRIFQKIGNPDVVCWNTIIAAYSQHGQAADALLYFEKMVQKGVAPTAVTYTTLFSICANQKWLEAGRQLHDFLKKSALDSDVGVGNSLICMYCKCNSLIEAQEVFDSMQARNLVTWSTIIAGHADQMHEVTALQLFYQLQMESIFPDSIIFTSSLCACASLCNLRLGKHIHACLSRTQSADVIIATALVNMYGKCECLQQAVLTFEKMYQHDLIAHNAMLVAYSRCNSKVKAMQHFQQILQEGVIPGCVTITVLLDACNENDIKEGKFIHACILAVNRNPNVDIATALITFYGKCDMLKDAELIFENLLERDIVTWNAMMAARSRHAQYIEVCQIFHQLQQECFIPNHATFASSLSACVTKEGLADGKRMHTCIVGAQIEADVVVGTSLIYMYGKCGNLEQAKLVFYILPHQNAITWNAFIAMYAQHGYSRVALQLFHDMGSRGISADLVTFSSVLSACSNGGYVDEGVRCFLSMVQVHGMKPAVQHFNCIINLLSRAGRLQEGENLMNFIPSGPVDAAWTTLLGACRMHLDVNRANRLVNQINQSGFESDSTSLLVKHIILLAENEVNRGIAERKSVN